MNEVNQQILNSSEDSVSPEAKTLKRRTDTRKMTKAELLGGHSHKTSNGTIVNIYQREGKFIARGRYQGKAFGLQLGSDETQAKSALIKLLSEIESGIFQRPTEAKKRPFKSHKIPNLDIRELINRYLNEKRRSVGQKTCKDYKNRLTPAVDFAEQPQSLKNWRYAAEIDRDFALGYREFLMNRQVTRNGRPGAAVKPISIRHIINCMEALRSLLAWACRIDIRLLPADFLNPMAGIVPTTQQGLRTQSGNKRGTNPDQHDSTDAQPTG